MKPAKPQSKKQQQAKADAYAKAAPATEDERIAGKEAADKAAQKREAKADRADD